MGADEDADLQEAVQEVWQQEQDIQRELQALQQDQEAILQALQDLRSSGELPSPRSPRREREGFSRRQGRSQTLNSNDSGSAVARRQGRSQTIESAPASPDASAIGKATGGMVVKSPTKSKVSLRGFSFAGNKSYTISSQGAGRQDAMARKSLYQAGRSMKDSVIRAVALPDGTASTDSGQFGSQSSALRGVVASTISKWCRRIARSSYFDAFVGLVIVANSLTIGTSVQYELEDKDIGMLEVVETVFLAFYVVELGIRFVAFRWACFKSGWYIFDFVLVTVGVISDWILGPILKTLENDGNLGFLEQVLIVRILRLLRLVRALRALELFKDMWKLVRGMMGSARTVISACLLIAGSLYVFGCVGVEVVTKDTHLQNDPRTAHIMERYFSSLPRVVLTLVQFANYDSIAAIYVPMITVRPHLIFYFMPIILVVPVCLMNLVTAVIVEHAIECAKTDADMAMYAMRKRLRDLKPQIKQVFEALDTSQDGKIQFSEVNFEQISIPDDLRDIIQPALLSDLFEFLDVDGSGELDYKEFENGVYHLALSSGMQGVSIESTQMLQLLRQQLLCIEDLQDRVCFLHERGALNCLRQMEWPEAGSKGLRRRMYSKGTLEFTHKQYTGASHRSSSSLASGLSIASSTNGRPRSASPPHASPGSPPAASSGGGPDLQPRISQDSMDNIIEVENDEPGGRGVTSRIR